MATIKVIATLAAATSIFCRAEAVTPRVAVVKIGTIIKDCPECPELVAVPQVGHTAENPGRLFYVGRYELTWKEYLSAVRAAGCTPPSLDDGKPLPYDDPLLRSHPAFDRYPAGSVPLVKFQCYIDWINRKTRKQYRLPNNAEWEHFARAGTTTNYPWGNNLEFGNAAVDGHYKPTTTPKFDPVVMKKVFQIVGWGKLEPVGSFKPNRWGLYDVVGNVFEYTVEKTIPTICLGITNYTRCDDAALRGGSASSFGRVGNFQAKTITFRWLYTGSYHQRHFGFRVVRDY